MNAAPEIGMLSPQILSLQSATGYDSIRYPRKAHKPKRRLLEVLDGLSGKKITD
jgi:hypothetical protein